MGRNTPRKRLRSSSPRPLRARLKPRSNSVRKRLRNVAILFADIEGCTRLCEDLPPLEMERVIERYFSRFLDVVHDRGGEITEILGDGLLALFEGRSLRADAARALSAGLGIVEAAEALNAARRHGHDAPARAQQRARRLFRHRPGHQCGRSALRARDTGTDPRHGRRRADAQPFSAPIELPTTKSNCTPSSRIAR